MRPMSRCRYRLSCSTDMPWIRSTVMLRMRVAVSLPARRACSRRRLPTSWKLFFTRWLSSCCTRDSRRSASPSPPRSSASSASLPTPRARQACRSARPARASTRAVTRRAGAEGPKPDSSRSASRPPPARAEPAGPAAKAASNAAGSQGSCGGERPGSRRNATAATASPAAMGSPASGAAARRRSSQPAHAPARFDSCPCLNACHVLDGRNIRCGPGGSAWLFQQKQGAGASLGPAGRLSS